MDGGLFLAPVLNAATTGHFIKAGARGGNPALTGSTGQLNAILGESGFAAPNVAGVTVVYDWRILEPRPGVYDFSVIQSVLDLINDHNRSSSASMGLMIEFQYHGETSGVAVTPYGTAADPHLGEYLMANGNYTAAIWDPTTVVYSYETVNQRYIDLLSALSLWEHGTTVNGNTLSYGNLIRGHVLPETSVPGTNHTIPTNYTDGNYLRALSAQMNILRSSFQALPAYFQTNYWRSSKDSPSNPVNYHFLWELARTACIYKAGVGMPDIRQYAKASACGTPTDYTPDGLIIIQGVLPPAGTYTVGLPSGSAVAWSSVIPVFPQIEAPDMRWPQTLSWQASQAVSGYKATSISWFHQSQTTTPNCAVDPTDSTNLAMRFTISDVYTQINNTSLSANLSPSYDCREGATNPYAIAPQP